MHFNGKRPFPFHKQTHYVRLLKIPAYNYHVPVYLTLFQLKDRVIYFEKPNGYPCFARESNNYVENPIS